MEPSTLIAAALAIILAVFIGIIIGYSMRGEDD